MNFLKKIFLSLVKTFKFLPIATTLFMAFFSTNAFSSEPSCNLVFTKAEIDSIVEKNRFNEQSKNELFSLAEQGFVAIQLEIAMNYLEGRKGFLQDAYYAKIWLRKASENQHAKAQDSIEEQAKAQYSLGSYLLTNINYKDNKNEAIRWFGEAALNGHEISQKHIRLFVEQGSPIAQLYLGKMYAKGVGVDQNYQQAILLIKLAAEQGDTEAIKTFRELAESEKPKVRQSAIQLLREVAQNENPEINQVAIQALKTVAENENPEINQLAIQTLREVAEHENSEINQPAIQILGEIAKYENSEASPAAIKALREVAENQNSEISQEAIKTLTDVATYGNSKVSPVAIKAFKTVVVTRGNSEELRQRGVHTLGEVAYKNVEASPVAIQTLIEVIKSKMFKEEYLKKSKQKAIQILGEVAYKNAEASPVAIKILEEVIKDGNSKEVQAAIKALTDVATYENPKASPMAIKTLEELAENENPKINQLAKKALEEVAEHERKKVASTQSNWLSRFFKRN